MQDVHRRTTKVVTSTKVGEINKTRTTKRKEKGHATLLKRKHLMSMMTKWYILK